MTSDMDPAPDDQATRGRIIVVASPKGGVGKSTVATNLAILLAKQDPLRTVLVDLDMQFGDVASQLDLKPDHTISEAVSVGLSDTVLLKTFLAPHPSGLLVLAGVESPVAGGRISDEQAADVLKLLASEFPVVIVDTGSGLVDHTLAALELATDVVLVTNMGVSSIKSVRRELDLLAALDLTFTRHVVLNFCDRISGLTVEVAQGVVGCSIDVVLPRVEDGPFAANVGIPIVLRKKPGVMGKGLSDLATRLGLESPVEEAAGRWASKRWKRQGELPPTEQTSEQEQTPDQDPEPAPEPEPAPDPEPRPDPELEPEPAPEPEPEREPEPQQRTSRVSWGEWKSKRQRSEEVPAQEERTEKELAPYGLAGGGTGQVARAEGELADDESAEDESGEDESAENESAEEEQGEVEQGEDQSAEDELAEDESDEDESAEDESAEDESAEEEQDEEEPDEEEQDEQEQDEQEQDEEEQDEEEQDEGEQAEDESTADGKAEGEQGGRRKRWKRKDRRLTSVEEEVQGEASQDEPGGRRKRRDGKRRRVVAENEQAERESSPEVQVQEEQDETSPEKRA